MLSSTCIRLQTHDGSVALNHLKPLNDHRKQTAIFLPRHNMIVPHKPAPWKWIKFNICKSHPSATEAENISLSPYAEGTWLIMLAPHLEHCEPHTNDVAGLRVSVPELEGRAHRPQLWRLEFLWRHFQRYVH